MKKLFGIALIIIGVLAIVFAFDCNRACQSDSELGAVVYSETYGGDAYTGMQNAAAKTANNVLKLTKTLTLNMGRLFLILGLTLVCVGIKISLEQYVTARTTTSAIRRTQRTYQVTKTPSREQYDDVIR